VRGEKDILALNAFDPRASRRRDGSSRDAVDRRLRAFGADSVLFYQQPIEMVEASGVWMIGADGRRYLDAYNNVPSVGHSHPRVVEAISRQAARLNIHTRYLNDVVDHYAERLLATFPDEIANLVLTCTGSEANDLALRIAQAATGGTGFIVSRTAYHGNTAAVAAISPTSRPGQPLAPHVRAVSPPDTYRQPAKQAAERLAEEVDAAIADLARHGLRLAGMIADTVFSSDGIHCDPAGVLRPALERVRAAGGVFIADEVQPGFGRTGAALWGFQRHGIVPEIVTMGKPMGNGFPMGGLALRPDCLNAFTEREKYFNTFGGNPVAAAAGLAVLDVIHDEGLIENARTVGDHFRKELSKLASRHEAVGDVRGTGLFIGLELVADQQTKAPAPARATSLIEGLRERGILVGAAGPYGNVLKIRPPLCFSLANADQFIGACDAVLGAQARPGKRARPSRAPRRRSHA
jgi:4-aminobutyrate aminotransferase-like enzyme